jgi:DNA-binding SARP family transcriptional activator
MRFCVLGPLEAYANGHRVMIGGGRERALLSLLLVHAGEIVSRDRLIDELWGGEPPSSGSQSLDVYLSRLRKAFREAGANNVLATRSPGYVLYAEETDARRFEILAAEGRDALATGDAGRAAERLMQALARWRGAAYLEVADEPWARAEAGRLEELRLAAIEDRIDAELLLGHHAALVGELEQLVARHRTRERLVGQLMLALYRSERQADALAAYRVARRSLVADLGLEPGPELRRLEAAVLRRISPSTSPQSRAKSPPRLARVGAGTGLRARLPLPY